MNHVLASTQTLIRCLVFPSKYKKRQITLCQHFVKYVADMMASAGTAFEGNYFVPMLILQVILQFLPNLASSMTNKNLEITLVLSRWLHNMERDG